jgi:hypothetical protein
MKILLFLLLPLISFSQQDTINKIEVKVYKKDTSYYLSSWLAVRVTKKGNIAIRNADSSISVLVVKKITPTIWGLMQEKLLSQSTTQQSNQVLNLLQGTPIKLVRVPLFVQQMGTHRDLIDSYLKTGLNVQINFDWSNTSSVAPFPKDTALIRQKITEFCNYYSNYINQIPVVVVENEWDNSYYHTGSTNDYLQELSICTEVLHKYEFKVADGGFSGNGLIRWLYSKLSGDSLKTWMQNYPIELSRDKLSAFVDSVNKIIIGFKTIPLDYNNVHWYNEKSDFEGFETVVKYYGGNLISNEFGMRQGNLDLFKQTINDVKDNVRIAIVYGGTNSSNASVISKDMLMLMK